MLDREMQIVLVKFVGTGWWIGDGDSQQADSAAAKKQPGQFEQASLAAYPVRKARDSTDQEHRGGEAEGEALAGLK